MYVVALIAKADKCAAHGNDVVVGVGREYDDALGENFRMEMMKRRGGAGVFDHRMAIFGGLSAGPTGDRCLERAESFDVKVVSAAARSDEVLQAVLVVILVGEFEHRLFHLLRKPRDG